MTFSYVLLQNREMEAATNSGKSEYETCEVCDSQHLCVSVPFVNKYVSVVSCSGSYDHKTTKNTSWCLQLTRTLTIQ